MNCGLSIIKPADKLLFPDDGFSPVISVGPDQAWLGVEFDLIGTVTAGASANGLGVSFKGNTKIGCSSYTQFAPTQPPLPLLRDACATAFDNFSLVASATLIRSQLPNTVNVSEVSGSRFLRKIETTSTEVQPHSASNTSSIGLAPAL